jgi:hypothetical protein
MTKPDDSDAASPHYAAYKRFLEEAIAPESGLVFAVPLV